MSSSIQETPQTPQQEPEPRFGFKPDQTEEVPDDYNEPYEEEEAKISVVQPDQSESPKTQAENQPPKVSSEPLSTGQQIKEENQIHKLEQNQPTQTQPKRNSNLPRDSHNSVEMNFAAPSNQNHPSQRFQVHIHKVDSRQSLSQHGEKRYQAIFTKSEMNIPIEYKGNVEEEEKANKQRLTQMESANCSIRPSQDDDFYVQYLEQKWAKKQQEQNEMNQLISNLQKNYQQNKKTSNNPPQQKPQPSPQTIEITHHEKSSSIPNKKTQFKVKKVPEKIPSSSTTNSKTNVSSTKLKPLKATQNKSQVITNNTGELKTYKYTRTGKKNLSSFENVQNKCSQKNEKIEKQSIYKNQVCQNVQYEISLGNSIEMMSHILEDRCYNTGNNKKTRQKNPQSIESKAQAGENGNNVRKIIKRSPYGILEIEVKDKKNNAKITNLRILKPKEMVQLKKIPNLVKGNKENCGPKSVVRLQEKSMSQKESTLGQGGLPLLNSNKK